MTVDNLHRQDVPAFDDYSYQPNACSLNGGLRALRPGASRADQSPMVSIVTIARNGVNTLPRAIESVFSQARDGIEHIIVDGGSTDGTLEVLRHNESRIALWISEPDRGISDAFNPGPRRNYRHPQLR